jgi:anti-sigma factor ChrR (cupin superfamily)
MEITRRALVANSIGAVLGMTLLGKAVSAGQLLEVAGSGNWQPVVPGLWVQPVWQEGEASVSIFKLDPGFQFAHKHPEGEFNIFLSGRLVIDGKSYDKGDTLYMPANSCHSGYTSRHGSEVIVMLPKQIIPLPVC